MPAKLYTDNAQGKRVYARAVRFADSAIAEIRVKQGEDDARFIVRLLAARGIDAIAESRGNAWFVRKIRKDDNEGEFSTGQSADWLWNDQRRQEKQPYPVVQNSQQSVCYAVSAKLTEALGAARNMEEFARDGDLIQLSNSGFQMKAALQTLWGLRKQRESDWQDLIAMLQAAINKEHFENFSVEQCKAVQAILETHLSSTPIDVSDLESTLRILRKVKLDPWKAA